MEVITVLKFIKEKVNQIIMNFPYEKTLFHVTNNKFLFHFW